MGSTITIIRFATCLKLRNQNPFYDLLWTTKYKANFKSLIPNLQNQFPTREQRLELSRVCNDAELAMNNGAMIRGPEGDTEGITEQRINTWFTNRRKGLSTPVTPSPTKGMTEKELELQSFYANCIEKML